MGTGAREEPDRRAQILGAGLRVFAERGYHRATIEEIVREAGIKSSALIYWYFEDKEALFWAILKEFSPLVRLAADPEALTERAPEEVLPMLARAHLGSYDDPVVVRLLRISLSVSALNPEAEDQFVGNAQRIVLKFFIAYLERQIELGSIRPHDPQSGARSFFGMLIIYFLNRKIFTHLKENLPEKEQYVKDVVGIFLNGLRERSVP